MGKQRFIRERSNDKKKQVHKSHSATHVSKYKVFKESKDGSSSSSNILFMDGNPLTFALVRKKIEDRFFQNECLDLIYYNPANVANPPVETAFLEDEPTEVEMIDNQIQNNRNSAVIHWQAISNLINTNAAGLAPAEIAKIQMINSQKELEALRTIDMTRTSLTSLFHTAHSSWQRNRDQHATRLAKCSRTFYTTFGPSIISCVQDMLHQNRFRRAWKYIIDKYAMNIGGQVNASVIMNKLTSSTYDRNKGMTQHINTMTLWYQQMETFGEPPISDNMKLAYLVSSIKRSGCNDFDSIINMHEMMNWTYGELTQQLYKKESVIIVENKMNNKNNNNHNNQRTEQSNNTSHKNKKNKKLNKKNNDNQDSSDDNSHDEQANSVNTDKTATVGNSATLLICNYCNRTGHLRKNCYFLNPCLHCGKTGHCSHMCYTLKNNSNKVNNMNNMNNNNNSNSNMNNNTSTFVPRHFGSNNSNAN